MAHEDFIRFLEEVNGDEALQGRIAELPTGTERETMDRIIELGAARGHEFSKQDVSDLAIASAVAEARDAGNELSLEALDAAAGGVGALGSSAMFSPSAAMSRLGANAGLMAAKFQQATQAQTQTVSMLSNLMKQQHGTAMAIINNMR